MITYDVPSNSLSVTFKVWFKITEDIDWLKVIVFSSQWLQILSQIYLSRNNTKSDVVVAWNWGTNSLLKPKL